MEKEIVKVFTTGSFENVVGVAMLEEILCTPKDDGAEPFLGVTGFDVEVEYVKYLDFRNVEQFKGYKNIIIMGCAYMGGNLPAELAIELDNPFTNVLHVATFGEPLPYEHVVSLVEEDKASAATVLQVLQTANVLTSIAYNGNYSKKAEALAEAANDYHNWTWYDNKITKILKSLHNAHGKYLPHLLKGKTVNSVVKEQQHAIAGQLMMMEEYIEDKLKQAITFRSRIGGVECMVRTTYAEQHVNEVANRLLEMNSYGIPVVACVGRTTNGNDMFSIRTKGVRADDFIQSITGERTGKEKVGNLFVPIKYNDLMSKSMMEALNHANG
ncbi:hypothetical protein JANET_193 [Bacillus phage Janet]|nr:hypothetical protein JANET_193 [Bacillus phage Janet]